jgi:hypothetical protein
MPKTLPGFLLLAGLVLVVVSCVRGRIEVAKVKVEPLDGQARWIFRLLGIIMMLLSAWLYITYASALTHEQKPLLMEKQPTQGRVDVEKPQPQEKSVPEFKMEQRPQTRRPKEKQK